MGDSGRALARRGRRVPEADLSDHSRVLDRLPDAPYRNTSRTGPDGSVLPATQLPRREVPSRALSRLRAAPTSANPIAPAILEAIVRGSTAQIRLLNTEITRLERDIADALAAHPKTRLSQTLPRVATVSLAALIAGVGLLLERCENPEQVAAMCGAAPSPEPPVSRAPSGSATPPTSQHASLSPALQTIHDTLPPGPATPTGEQAHAAPGTPTPCESLPAAGSA